ncbi:MAG: nitric-oxide reductase large subunit, partial [Ignavibacteria bacterium]|nr:nitric-oxide reductase large subunit [Ignavibacteria bacterium]
MKKYWLGFTLVILVSFSVLGWVGAKIYQQAPPIAERVVTATGQVVFESGAIEKGQNVWQAMGGMEVGSIWGHGSYTAPDWTADWLHREAMFILNEWSKTDYNTTYSQLDVEKQSLLQARLSKMMRNNTYDPTTNQIRIEEVRARAIEDNVKYYSTLFSEGSGSYAIQKGSVTDPVKLRELSAFFFWSSWAASTNRPGDNITYTSNWPHEKLVDNQPTGDSVVWTGVSIIMLLAGIGGMAWFYASREKKHPGIIYPSRDPLLGSKATPSQKAVVKYFWTVAGLFLLQILMGVISAHYGVEGNKFYGFDIAKILPYSVVRTWHTQLGIFWIATAWLAAGLYISPAVSGVEPKGQ